MQIAAAGLGYVGFSNAVLLDRHNKVLALATNAERVTYVNQRHCFLHDAELQDYMQNKPVNLHATHDMANAYFRASYWEIASFTN